MADPVRRAPGSASKGNRRRFGADSEEIRSRSGVESNGSRCESVGVDCESNANSLPEALGAGQPGKRPSDYRLEWEALKREAVALEADTTTRGLPADHSTVLEHEAAVAALNDRKKDVAHLMWMAKARCHADLQMLAEIAHDWWWDIATFPRLPAYVDDRPGQEVAVAALVRGIADVHEARKARDAADDEAAAAGDVSDLADDIGTVHCQVRGGLTTLRAVLDWWMRGHGPQNQFSEADGHLIAALRFCADAMEAALDSATERLEEA